MLACFGKSGRVRTGKGIPFLDIKSSIIRGLERHVNALSRRRLLCIANWLQDWNEVWQIEELKDAQEDELRID
jgi:hypothetical protein